MHDDIELCLGDNDIITDMLEEIALNEFLATIDVDFLPILKRDALTYKISVEKSLEGVFSNSFIDHNQKTLAANLNYPNKYAEHIFKKAFDIKYSVFIQEFLKDFSKYIYMFEDEAPIDYKGVVFGLTENYRSISDISYFGYNFMLFDLNERTHFNVKFHCNPTEPKFELMNDQMCSNIRLKEFQLSVHYKDLPSLYLKMMEYYKSDLNKLLGYEVNTVDKSILDIVDMIHI